MPIARSHVVVLFALVGPLLGGCRFTATVADETTGSADPRGRGAEDEAGEAADAPATPSAVGTDDEPADDEPAAAASSDDDPADHDDDTTPGGAHDDDGATPETDDAPPAEPCAPGEGDAACVPADAETCGSSVLERTGEPVCVASYPEVLPAAAFSDGRPASCGGDGATRVFGYPNFPFVSFASGPTTVAEGDVLRVTYADWASGPTGEVAVDVLVSPDGAAWSPCATTSAEERFGAAEPVTVACTAPFAATTVHVRLAATTSHAALFLRRFALDVGDACGD